MGRAPGAAGRYRGDLSSFGVHIDTRLRSPGEDRVSVEIKHQPAVG